MYCKFDDVKFRKMFLGLGPNKPRKRFMHKVRARMFFTLLLIITQVLLIAYKNYHLEYSSTRDLLLEVKLKSVSTYFLPECHPVSS